jgi:hypothetical protein
VGLALFVLHKDVQYQEKVVIYPGEEEDHPNSSQRTTELAIKPAVSAHVIDFSVQQLYYGLGNGVGEKMSLPCFS